MKKEKTGTKRFVITTTVLILLVVLICFLFIPLFQNLKFGLDLQGGFEVLYKAESIDGSKMTNSKLTATYKTLSKRIDSLGVSEPEIILEGNDKIRVKLAGVKNPEEARTQLSTVATLSFRDTDDNLLMTSDVLKAGGAKIGQDSAGNPAVALSVKDKDKFYEVTNKVKDMEKNMTIALTEASNEKLYNAYLKMFDDIKNMQREAYELMFEFGWYSLEEAKTTKVDTLIKELETKLENLNN